MPREKVKSTADYLKLVMKGIKGMTTVSEMEELRYVPTSLTSYNRATGIGGHPLGCLVLIHGPNQVGKSALGLAILESLRRRGHPSLIYDSEFAAEKEWYNSISPLSGIKQTTSLNVVHDDLQKALVNLQKGKDAGKIPRGVGLAAMLDTATKLLPDDVLDEIRKNGPERAYPIQANFISTWMKAIIEQVYNTSSTVVMILQERTKMNAKPFEQDYNIPGGRSIQYDNRLRARVYYAKKVRIKDKVVGFESRYTIENNKFVGTSMEKGMFFTANGAEKGVPKGLDLVREALAEADHRKWLVKRGRSAVVKYGNKTLVSKNGESGLRRKLMKDEDRLKELVDALNSNVVSVK